MSGPRQALARLPKDSTFLRSFVSWLLSAAYLAAGEFPALPYGPAADTSLQPFNTTTAGGGSSISHLNPYQCINFIIALQGIFPSRN